MNILHGVNIRFSPGGINYVGDVALLGNVGIMLEPKPVQDRNLDIRVSTGYIYRQNAFLAFSLHEADFCESPGTLARVQNHLKGEKE